MKLSKKIKRYIAKQKFMNRCFHVRCTNCPNHRMNDAGGGYCQLAKELGLED